MEEQSNVGEKGEGRDNTSRDILPIWRCLHQRNRLSNINGLTYFNRIHVYRSATSSGWKTIFIYSVLVGNCIVGYCIVFSWKTFLGSSQDNVHFCSRQEGTWPGPRNYSVPSCIIAGGRERGVFFWKEWLFSAWLQSGWVLQCAF